MNAEARPAKPEVHWLDKHIAEQRAYWRGHMPEDAAALQERAELEGWDDEPESEEVAMR